MTTWSSGWITIQCVTSVGARVACASAGARTENSSASPPPAAAEAFRKLRRETLPPPWGRIGVGVLVVMARSSDLLTVGGFDGLRRRLGLGAGKRMDRLPHARVGSAA